MALVRILLARLRRFGPLAALLVSVAVVVAAGAAALARGLGESSGRSAPLPILRWSNEGISDLYTLDPARGPDFNARQAVQLIWRKVLGVRVRLAQYSHSTYLSLLSNLRYQAAVIDWNADYPDPENFISQQFHTGSPNNNAGWSNATFDRLVDRADRLPAADPARFGLYRRAEQLAMSQAVTIPLANPFAGILLRRSVRGISISGGFLLAKHWSQVSLAGQTGS